MAARHIFRSCVFFLVVVSAHCEGGVPYYGRYIGPLSRLLHSVSGDVYAVDARTLHIRDFTYDGEGPAAYFYAGNSKAVGPGGFFVRDETGSNGVLKKYNKKHITITLPEGKNLNNIRWFSVWCEEFAVNFGDIQIPRGLDFPKPQKIGGLSGVHAVSSENIVIVDAQTLLIPSFSYDGEAPDAKFWVGRGSKPSPQGIRVPDENGKQTPLRRYERKTIVLTLPGDLTIFDIGHFGVWCEAFTVDFGHVQVPASLNVPPSLKMLGVSPQKRSLAAASQNLEVYTPGPQAYSSAEYIRPTTYRPPSHRFSSVQLQPSRSVYERTIVQPPFQERTIVQPPFQDQQYQNYYQQNYVLSTQIFPQEYIQPPKQQEYNPFQRQYANVPQYQF
nr:protein Skeletor, isoforms B/C-like isoform X2 [Halyomorpha halys]